MSTFLKEPFEPRNRTLRSTTVEDHAHSTLGHLHVFGRNALLKTLGEMSRLFQMTFFVVIARRFGPAVLGNLTVLLMVGSAVGLFFGDFGINTVLIARMSSSDREGRNHKVSTAFSLKVVLSFGAVAIMCSGMYLTKSSHFWFEILAVATISLGGLWLEFLTSIMNGVNRFDSEVWLRIAYRGFVFGVGTLCALLAPVSTDLLYMAIATLAVLLAALIYIRRNLIPVDFSVEFKSQLLLLKQSLPVWVTQLAQLTYLKFDVVILGLLHVAALETGWYAAAWKMVDVLTTIPSLLAMAALPLLSGATSSSSIASMVPKYLKLIYVLPLFFVLPIAIGADWIVRLLYGPNFTGTPQILRILVWALVPIFIHSFLAVLSVATHRQAATARLATLVSVLGLLTAVFVVPRAGYRSMATICLIANSFFALAMVYKFKFLAGSTQISTAAKSLGSALTIEILCSYAAPHIHPLVLMAGGTLSYLLSLLLLGVISTGNMRIAWQFAGGLLSSRVAAETTSL